ncbi:MAG: hypothetical protein MZW92_53345 [Comamonadaceae bacterium]|nr:hypothetical protein [Comamonadaceae bacterium]
MYFNPPQFTLQRLLPDAVLAADARATRSRPAAGSRRRRPSARSAPDHGVARSCSTGTSSVQRQLGPDRHPDASATRARRGPA